MGQRYGRPHGSLTHTEELSDRLLRLPLFPKLTLDQVEAVVTAIQEFYSHSYLQRSAG